MYIKYHVDGLVAGYVATRDNVMDISIFSHYGVEVVCF